MNKFSISIILLLAAAFVCNAQELTDYVNPFIGTSNYGTTNPGPIAPRGMVNLTPFNAAGKQNKFDKDSQWFSTPYEHTNTFLTGFSHVNLSGVGCPDLGVLLLMPTTGNLETNHFKYGSTYKNENAEPGYYRVDIDKYNVITELTASKRVGISRYTFPKGKSNVLLNLGLGLTNESGAMVQIVSDTEIEGMRTVGSFCYNSPENAYPVYFVAKFSKPADEFGTWNTPKKYDGVEAQWMGYNGKTRIMNNNTKMIAGDSIGTFFTYNFKEKSTVEVKLGVSYVSIENARENLEKETMNKSFENVRIETKNKWNETLSRIKVEGGTEEDKTIFYSALYHTQIHPNTFNDINGDYQEIGTGKVANTDRTRYTVFSLWDTYRNTHQLLSLIFPKQQSDMIKTMLQMYDENGWLPKWELNSTETFTMVGDPAAVVIADTYLKGIKDFDVNKAYEAMLKSADQIENNPVRKELKEYLERGYITEKSTKSGAVSITQEFNIADFAIAQLANELGKEEDAKRFYKRSTTYRILFDKEFNLLRPRSKDGTWHEPFSPDTGANFVKNIAFIEGNSWQYTFMVTHDTPELIKLMGGKKGFVNQLEKVFSNKQFDMANEPDIGYPYLFNYIKGEEHRTQKHVSNLIKTHYKNNSNGIPGNDDTGTMSSWLVYSMMGIYPIIPGKPVYTITKPVFDKVTIELDTEYYKNNSITITKQGTGAIDKIELNGRKSDFFISHDELVNGNNLNIILK
ncbi:GH92 family glycosyl hydrolase [Urechidicola vernalis]|uniref:GH92 family glycosyl hydrolase n=1 Tax=Urechidicola vernalis TaxID=3075600 RepID=A0ABU2Y7L6_9FLAO|nr:GH92 family glycosyl hydrolase [Urechidicola sp. P050]MDT0553225.1 GH92 family glycosyl hydrolase [Urechidicola sp. P050]